MVYDNKCQNRSITNLQNKLRANLQLEETFLKPLVLINCSLLTLRATFTSNLSSQVIPVKKTDPPKIIVNFYFGCLNATEIY